MNSSHIAAPSENWDDDFEFQQKETAGNENNVDTDSYRMSFASSHFTDWDDASRVRTPAAATTVLEDKKNIYRSHLANWADATYSTPVKRPAHATENWDDDFEDSPLRKFPLSTPVASTPSTKAGNLCPGPAASTKQLESESWDDEYNVAQSSPSSLFPPSASGRPRQICITEDHSSSEGAVDCKYDSEGDSSHEFGSSNKEEDKTVTARSRRTAFARLTARGTPPPPVPPIPPPFLLDPSLPSNPHPFPRSPTSSVFSVPTSVTSHRPSSSHHTNTSASSTTYLRPMTSRTSGGFGALPPSPPIHKERGRRRLRKKSRPHQAFELNMGTFRADGDVGDEALDSMDDVVMRTLTPLPVGPDVASPPVTPSNICGSAAPVLGGLNMGTGKGGALLSRIGSVKQWGMRRKSRNSVTPSASLSMAQSSVVDFTTAEYDHNLTPRPQSSLSYLPSSGAKHQHRAEHDTSPVNPSAHWLFRDIHPRSQVTSIDILGANTDDLNFTGGKENVSVPALGSSDSTKPGMGAESGRIDVQSPSKPMQRKSTGPTQPRRGPSGSVQRFEDGKEDEWKRTTPNQTGLGGPGPRPQKRYASYGRFGLWKTGGGVGIGGSADDLVLGGSRVNVAGFSIDELEQAGMEREGKRKLMASVSLVGEYKRTKSDLSLAGVTEADQYLVKQTLQPPTLLPPIELQPPSPPRPRAAMGPIPSSPITCVPPSLEPISRFTSSSPTLSMAPSPTSIVRRRPPSHRSPKTAGSPQSASLGRSTVVPGTAMSASICVNTGTSEPGSGAPPMRRNSLGDLKIPERISQAQVSLRRDLGMVREFAAHVEQLKQMRSTYNALVIEIQRTIDAYAHSHSRADQHQLTGITQSSLFNHFARPLSRHRSNTSPTNLSPSTSYFHLPAYKQLASAFYTVNSKYRIAWECAELLIELGDGTTGIITTHAAPSTSVSAPAMHLSGGAPSSDTGIEGKKSRERAITLTGDEWKPSAPTVFAAVAAGSVSSVGPSPPMASPPSLAWRASTGRHDLSHRQLVLLKEMLHSADSSSSSSFVAEDVSNAIPEEPAIAPLNVNRDWRWGAAMSSTVTLPSEESEVTGGGGRTSSPNHKRSSKLGMSGLRDMLRSLRRNHREHPAQTPIPASSTSLSIDSSLDSHRYQHVHVPSEGRRRAKISSGPESMRLGGLTSPYNPPSLSSMPSPRRPSLASIFRIGHKNKGISPASSALDGGGDDFPRSADSRSSMRESSGNGEEEDWDRMDSAPDINAAVGALGPWRDGSATVRGRGRMKGQSPYLPHTHVPPGLPGRPPTPKQPVGSSQSSICGDSPSNHLPPTRATRLSNVEEHVDGHRQPRSSSRTRHGSSGDSPSRPSSTVAKSGSVRSMPPHSASSLLPDPKLAITPQNIKPLLESAKGVHAQLNQCITEIRSLLAAPT